MMSTVLIAALSPWCGSKRNLAPTIAEELGPHSCYWEPFCGSMAVLLCKAACPMETVNDLHGDLINLGRVIQDAKLAPQLYRRARRVLGARQFSDEAAARFRERGNMPASDVPDLECAYDYLLSSWMGRNGVAGTSSYNQGFSRRFTVNGGHSGKRWASVVQSIPQWRRRMASGDDPIRGWDWTHRTDRGSSPRSDLLRPTLPGQRREIRLRLRRGRPRAIGGGLAAFHRGAGRSQLLRSSGPGEALSRLDAAEDRGQQSDGIAGQQNS